MTVTAEQRERLRELLGGPWRDAMPERAALRELIEAYDALLAERDALAAALKQARAYVEEPGAPGTIIETTEGSARRSAALLAEIDAALAAADAVTGRSKT